MSPLIGKQVRDRLGSTQGVVQAVGCNKGGFRLLIETDEGELFDVDATDYERVHPKLAKAVKP